MAMTSPLTRPDQQRGQHHAPEAASPPITDHEGGGQHLGAHGRVDRDNRRHQDARQTRQDRWRCRRQPDRYGAAKSPSPPGMSGFWMPARTMRPNAVRFRRNHSPPPPRWRRRSERCDSANR